MGHGFESHIVHAVKGFDIFTLTRQMNFSFICLLSPISGKLIKGPSPGPMGLCENQPTDANCNRIGGRILLPRVNDHRPRHTAI